MRVRWDEITAVQRRRHQLIMPVEELIVVDSELLGRTVRGVRLPPPNRVIGHPATSRIMISLYDPGWRSGRIGDELHRRGII